MHYQEGKVIGQKKKKKKKVKSHMHRSVGAVFQIEDRIPYGATIRDDILPAAISLLSLR